MDWSDKILENFEEDMGRDWLAEVKKDAKTLILAHERQAVEEVEKAFGGCKNCYGKGYATVNDKWLAVDTDQDIGSPGGRTVGGKDFAIKYCTCSRGKQLEALTAPKEEVEDV